MIIWSGWGILLPVAFLLGVILPLLVKAPLPDEWLFTIGVILGTVFSWIVSLTVAKTKVTTLLDPQTHRPVLLKSRHTFFFIPVRFYCWLATALSIFVLGCAVTGNLAGFGSKDGRARSTKFERPAAAASGDTAPLSPTTHFPATAVTHDAVSAFYDEGITRIPAESEITVTGFQDGRYAIVWHDQKYTVAGNDLSAASLRK